MDRYKFNIGGGGKTVHLFIKILLIYSFSHSVVSQYPGFFWENEHLVKPIPYIGGAEFKIAVIAEKVVEIKCKVRVDADEIYNIRWDYDGFNANNTGTFIVGAVGSEYAVSTVTINIDNPGEIDDKNVFCMKENGETISLRFKVFVHDSNVPCGACNGTEHVKLRRWGNKKTQDEDLQEGFKQNLIKMLKKEENFADGEVYPASNGTTDICGCKYKYPTTRTTTTPKTSDSSDSDPEQMNPAAWAAPLSISLLLCIVALIIIISKKNIFGGKFIKFIQLIHWPIQ